MLVSPLTVTPTAEGDGMARRREQADGCQLDQVVLVTVEDIAEAQRLAIREPDHQAIGDDVAANLMEMQMLKARLVDAHPEHVLLHGRPPAYSHTPVERYHPINGRDDAEPFTARMVIVSLSLLRCAP